MDPKNETEKRRSPRVTTVDLSSIAANVGVIGEYPIPGRYGGVSIEDVAIDCTGLRHVIVRGNMREVVDCLRFMGRTEQATALLLKHNLDHEAFMHPERWS